MSATMWGVGTLNLLFGSAVWTAYAGHNGIMIIQLQQKGWGSADRNVSAASSLHSMTMSVQG